MSEWKEYKLGDVAYVQTGPFGSQLHLSDYKLTGTPIITVEHLVDKRIGHTNTPFVSDEDRERLKKYTLIPGDIVFSRVGSVDRSAIVSTKENGWLFSGRLLRVRITDIEVDPLYTFYFFNQEEFKENIRRIAVGATMPSINTAILSSLPILLPPLAEQKAIAGVLSALDDKIDLLHRQNKTLEAMAEALFRQWLVEEADESWEEGKLGDEFIITMGQSPPGESYNETGKGIPMYQGNADFEFRFPKNRVFTTDPKRFAEKFDTLISVRAPVGAQNMANEKCCIGRGVASLRFKLNTELYSYTYYKIRYHMLEIAGFNDTGTVFGSIGKDDLWNIKTLFPSVTEIMEIDSKLKPLNDRIISNCFQIRSLEKLRDTLLPKLMSGEVRVGVK
ncbi:MAG: restriction endonuclease subunit S [Leptospira sp.]|nr:restriction endonuclease subunit S [Leptospira sp.]